MVEVRQRKLELLVLNSAAVEAGGVRSLWAEVVVHCLLLEAVVLVGQSLEAVGEPPLMARLGFLEAKEEH